VDLGALTPAAVAIEECARRILDGRTASLGSADGADIRVIGIVALISGMGPLLGYWIERGLLDVSEPLAHLLGRHLAHGRTRVARIRREIAPALEALIAAGTAPGILKGFHTAHVYFPEPGLRPLADVDVYVDPTHEERAAQALAGAGFVASHNEAHFKSDWYPPGGRGRIRSLEMWHARSPWKIELHSALEFGTLLRHGVCLENAVPITAPWDTLGVPLRTAPQPLLFVAATVHLSSELLSARLLRLVELVFIARRDVPSGALDWAAVEDLLERTGATRFTYPAFALVEQLAPGTVPPNLHGRAHERSSRIARSVVAALTPATPILTGHVSFAERLMWEPGPLGIARRVLQMVLPARRVPTRDVLSIYASRLRRLCTGRVAWGLAPRA